jgi:hypothetical protein
VDVVLLFVMGTILPTRESLRRAVQWISEQRTERPEARLSTLVDEAALRFDLSPLDQEWLWKTFAAPPSGKKT